MGLNAPKWPKEMELLSLACADAPAPTSLMRPVGQMPRYPSFRCARPSTSRRTGLSLSSALHYSLAHSPHRPQPQDHPQPSPRTPLPPPADRRLLRRTTSTLARFSPVLRRAAHSPQTNMVNFPSLLALGGLLFSPSALGAVISTGRDQINNYNLSSHGSEVRRRAVGDAPTTNLPFTPSGNDQPSLNIWSAAEREEFERGVAGFGQGIRPNGE